mgnify:CR=1 FL=1
MIDALKTLFENDVNAVDVRHVSRHKNNIKSRFRKQKIKQIINI